MLKLDKFDTSGNNNSNDFESDDTLYDDSMTTEYNENWKNSDAFIR